MLRLYVAQLFCYFHGWKCKREMRINLSGDKTQMCRGYSATIEGNL